VKGTRLCVLNDRGSDSDSGSGCLASKYKKSKSVSRVT
jgi:hypothetical protein